MERDSDSSQVENVVTALMLVFPASALIAWIGIFAVFLHIWLSLWASGLIAIPLSIAGMVVFLKEHGGSLVEIAIGSFISLVLAALLWGAVAKVKTTRLHHHLGIAYAGQRPPTGMARSEIG